MLGAVVLRVEWVEMGDFSSISSIWVKSAVVNRILRPMVAVEHASRFKEEIDGVFEEKLAEFVEISLEG